MRAGVYTRISQDRDGQAAGVGRQEADCRALCERNGWDVAGVYVDNDVSAFGSKRRPEYERLLADLAERTVNAVVVWHPDRLTRRPVELERLIEVLEATGAKAATVMSGDYDLATSSGRLVARILGATARGESERMAERIRRANDDRAASGLPHVGGPRAFGFEADKVTVVPAEAAEVRLMADRLLAGGSLRSIAVDLNERGVEPPGGTLWTGRKVRQFLLAPRVAGLRQHRGEVIGAGSWPALLDRATWEAVRVALTGDRVVPRRPRRYLLAGVLHCWRCGNRLYGRQVPKRRARYHCLSHVDGGCNGTTIDLAKVDDQLTRLVLARWTTLRDDPAPDVEVPTTHLEARQVELAELWADGTIGRDEYLAARQVIETQLTAARGSRSHLSAVRRVVSSDPAAEWERLALPQQRAVIDALVERVVVGPAVRGRNRYDGDRIVAEPGRIVWRV